MTNAEYAAALRQIADWYEAHSEMKQPFPVLRVGGVYGRKELSAFARALGTCKKSFDEKFARVERDFGGVVLEAFDWRENVCERVVLGHRIVPKKVIPRQVIPEHEEEIIEWGCPESLLDEENAAGPGDGL